LGNEILIDEAYYYFFILIFKFVISGRDVTFAIKGLSTVVFLLNHLPFIFIDFNSPFFRLFKTHPDYSILHTFGCLCFVHLPPLERHKLKAQSIQCAFFRV